MDQHRPGEELPIPYAVPELSKLLDGTEQLVAVTVIPLYVRQVFLPSGEA